jgi:predicted short-subunit dehydrogenase-like oxidoreductase (DUF2520 family)
MFAGNISFAGAGRVAGALCSRMFEKGYRIDLIVSESDIKGKQLADSCNAGWSSRLKFPDSTNIIIVAVPDHSLKSVLESIICTQETLVVHTAGSFGFEIFPENIGRKGIFYPLQTFSRNREIQFNGLPFLIESSDKESSDLLRNIAESIGGKVHFVDSERRRMIHLAAVFVSNFTNHMLTMGNEVALKAGFTSDILEPLIKETISKALDLGPENSQTGPAVRNDQNTIEKHLELLSFSPDMQRIYNEMTRSIIEYHKTKNKS